MSTFRTFGFVLLTSVGLLASLPVVETVDNRRASRAVDEWSATLKSEEPSLLTVADATEWFERNGMTPVRAPYALGYDIFDSSTIVLWGYLPVSKGGVLTSPKTVQMSIQFDAGTELRSDRDCATCRLMPGRPPGIPATTSWGTFSRRLIPLFPLAWMPFVLFFEHRRHTRQRLGLCSACGYPMGSSELCNECGSPVQSNRGSWSSTIIAVAILCVLLGAVTTVLLAVSCPALTYEGEHAEPREVIGEWPPNGPHWCVTGLLSHHGCETFYAGKYDPVCDNIAPETVESWLPEWSVVRASSPGRLYEIAGSWPAPDDSEAEIVEYATGWPWQALRAYEIVVFDFSESSLSEIADLRWGVRVSDRVVPLLPIPAGFLLSTILFGAIWALTAFVPIASWHLTNRCSWRSGRR